jgi:hypothetical protein
MVWCEVVSWQIFDHSNLEYSTKPGLLVKTVVSWRIHDWRSWHRKCSIVVLLDYQYCNLCDSCPPTYYLYFPYKVYALHTRFIRDPTLTPTAGYCYKKYFLGLTLRLGKSFCISIIYFCMRPYTRWDQTNTPVDSIYTWWHQRNTLA